MIQFHIMIDDSNKQEHSRMKTLFKMLRYFLVTLLLNEIVILILQSLWNS